MSYQKLSQTILDAFHIEIYDPYRADVQDGKLYDTVSFREPVNHECDLFFDVPLSEMKSYALTNMRQARRMPAPEAFSVSRISFAFSYWTSPEVQLAIAEDSFWELFIGMKYYQRSQLCMMEKTTETELELFRCCNHCQSVYCGSRNCTNCGSADFRVWNKELIPADGRAVEYFLNLQVPLVLGNQTDFYIRFIHPKGVMRQPYKLKCWLSGLHSRGIS